MACPYTSRTRRSARRSSSCATCRRATEYPDRLVRGSYVHLDVPEGAPVRRLEDSPIPTVGEEDVVHAACSSPLDVVAIALFSFRVDERLRVGETHGATGTAARYEHRV